jgi:hypothetical protein
MSDTKIEYDDKFGIETFKREIVGSFGEQVWRELTDGGIVPDIETEHKCSCSNMAVFMERYDRIADKQTAKQVLSRVRHGLKPSDCKGAREKFLEAGDLDEFIKCQIQESISDFEKLCDGGMDFYGQPITKEVLDFIKANPGMTGGVRDGNKLYLSAFPAEMAEYLNEADPKMKRYRACHCPFAKSSILAEKTVSPTLCYCSFGHVKNFWEAVFDEELDGEVLTSVLNGDMDCTYVVYIPDDIMDKYVK